MWVWVLLGAQAPPVFAFPHQPAVGHVPHLGNPDTTLVWDRCGTPRLAYQISWLQWLHCMASFQPILCTPWWHLAAALPWGAIVCSSSGPAASVMRVVCLAAEPGHSSHNQTCVLPQQFVPWDLLVDLWWHHGPDQWAQGLSHTMGSLAKHRCGTSVGHVPHFWHPVAAQVWDNAPPSVGKVALVWNGKHCPLV